MKNQALESPKYPSPDKGRLQHGHRLVAREIVSEERLKSLAALAAKVQKVKIREAKAPRIVMTAIQELNEIAQLAARTQLGLDKAEQLFRGQLAGATSQDYDFAPGERATEVLAALTALDEMPGFNGPCGDLLDGAVEVLQAAFSLDVRDGKKLAVQTYEAESYLRSRMRTIAQFEGALWRGINGRDRGSYSDELGGQHDFGRAADLLWGPENPLEQILTPNIGGPLPDPPPDFGGIDPGLCEHLGGLCMSIFQISAEALLSDPYLDLIASVEPSCLCYDYDQNQIFIAKPPRCDVSRTLTRPRCHDFWRCRHHCQHNPT